MKVQSIEELKLHIQDIRSQKAMDEVLSCFYSKNFRSAVVMLYATVVSDLYYKLFDLVEKYNDIIAKEILQYVQDEWVNNKTSPNWESEMPERCYKKNKILKIDSYNHFLSLQKERHLCAHPTLLECNSELYVPNPAKVQGLIIDMLCGILCRPSFLSKDFFNSFLEDIESSRKIFSTMDNLVEHIKAKYIDKIDNQEEEFEIIKKLWDLIFKCEDDRANDNREYNYAVFKCLLARNNDFVVKKIISGVERYTAKINLNNTDCLWFFVDFLNNNSGVYSQLNKDFTMKFKGVISKMKLSGIAFFLRKEDESVSTYAVKCWREDDMNFDMKRIQYIYEYIKQNCNENIAIDYAIEIYQYSNQYDIANSMVDCFIRLNLSKMSEAQLERIINYSCKNSQIYDAWSFKNCKCLIKSAMEKINPKFDYAKFQIFQD